ncbi:apolipoprotein N-acyltransferase [Hirschia baltica]|uniref:Apolipoprotein N-acyltransferase n=1 Tax=Hirschia baltica (strain ATCC 49814 / DSM 5838 / IFAM 1418) TaxID=582402 RepID=C6XIE4_HIRBI|nr:apolipoprotein N-acyltransferase [Hirschia baltica]ACT60751.1 apolipoprotein N-acyltransferase [Hirschia baltica ATCC 49814]
MFEKFKTVGEEFAPSGNFLAVPYNFLNGLSGTPALVACFVFGALSNLSFAPLNFWPMMMISLVALVWMIDGATRQKKPRSAVFARTLLFAFGQFGVGFHWVAFAFLVDAKAHAALVWMSMLLPLGLAFIWAVIMRLAINFWVPGPARVMLFALTLFIAEWTRGHLFGGFPWNIPAMVWAPGGSVSQTASVFGVWGLSLLTLVFFSAPAALCDGRTQVGTKMGSVGRSVPIILVAVIFGSAWGWGSHRLSDATSQSVGPEVRLVDVGVPQSEKFKPEIRKLVLRRYLQLTQPDTGDNPRIVIWPEGAVPYALLQYPDALDPVTETLGARRLIVGTSFVDRTQRPERWYNSMAVLSAESPVAEAIYKKHRLVPFGEMVPFRKLASRIGIGALQQIAEAGFHAGPPPAPLSVEGVPDFQPLICYEALFPGLLPKRNVETEFSGVESDMAFERADWIVNISIDSWFGPLWAPYQHFEHAKYRAIEEGLPMARVASRGISGMVDGYGRVTDLAHAPDFEIYPEDPKGWKSRILDSHIPNALPPTMYSKYRDVFAIGMILLILICWITLPRD